MDVNNDNSAGNGVVPRCMYVSDKALCKFSQFLSLQWLKFELFKFIAGCMTFGKPMNVYHDNVAYDGVAPNCIYVSNKTLSNFTLFSSKWWKYAFC